MDRKIVNQYPDYMQDFPDIQKFIYAQWKMFNMIDYDIINLANAALACGNGSNMWDELIETSYTLEKEMLPVIFALDYVATSKNIEQHLYRWFGMERCRVEYVPETMTVKIKTDMINSNYEKYEKYIRWFIPYNLSYEIEKVEELD